MTAVRWADLTTVEARAAIDRADLAILPVGAVEQHGPHLTVMTDASIAEAFAAALGDELGPRAIVCPLQPYGISEHHERFAGTITLNPMTFIAVMLDLVAGLKAQGLSKVVIVNGHGGNIDALRIVARRARSELGVPVASMMWATLARDVCAAEAADHRYGHACELETSVAMVLASGLVRPDVPAEPGTYLPVEPLSAPHGYVDVADRFDELTANGVYGDPRRASAELGDRIVRTALDRAVGFCTAFAEEAPS